MDFDFETLNDIQDAAEGFLDKSFRTDSKLHLSVTSVSGNCDEGVPEIKFSPRLAIDKDGKAFGKVKIGCTATTSACLLYQRVSVTNDGAVAAKIDVEGKEVENGVQLKGGARIVINTVLPPADDSYGVSLVAARPDSYIEFDIDKASNGSSVANVKAGLKFYNGIFGVDHTHSFGAEDFARSRTTSFGLGFTGDRWGFSSVVRRDPDSWTGACAALVRRHRKILTVAMFDLDLKADDPVKVVLGCEQKARIRFPKWLGEGGLTPIWAVRADTDGMVSTRVGIPFRGAKYTLTGSSHILGKPSFGVSIRVD